MVAPVVRVEGLRDLSRAMRRADADLAELKDANARAAAYVAAVAAARAPHRTGRLAASVRGNRAQGAAVVRGGGARVPYAGPIHWGWPARKIAARTFVVDAARDTESTWLGFYQQDLEKIIDKLGNAT